MKHGGKEKETKVEVSKQAPVTTFGKSLRKSLAKKDVVAVATTAVVKTTKVVAKTISVRKKAKVGKKLVSGRTANGKKGDGKVVKPPKSAGSHKAKPSLQLIHGVKMFR